MADGEPRRGGGFVRVRQHRLSQTLVGLHPRTEGSGVAYYCPEFTSHYSVAEITDALIDYVGSEHGDPDTKRWINQYVSMAYEGSRFICQFEGEAYEESIRKQLDAYFIHRIETSDSTDHKRLYLWLLLSRKNSEVDRALEEKGWMKDGEPSAEFDLPTP